MSVARRHLARERRHRRRYVPFAFESDKLALLADRRTAPSLAAADRAQVAAAVARLPEKHRAVVRARHWGGEVQQQVADRTGVCRQAVSELEKTAHRRLAELLAGLDPTG